MEACSTAGGERRRAAAAWLFAAAAGSSLWVAGAALATTAGGSAADGVRFATSHDCLACHNNLITPSGEDISIGSSWRGSMMAQSARDPYWQASVRRETLDHPSVAGDIEDECAVCHMPMARTLARAAGRLGRVFAHLAAGAVRATEEARLAADGVSCTLCHRIRPEAFGTHASFTGGYVLDEASPPRVFGPFAVDPGRLGVMHSATGFVPTEAAHVRQSELCATCHTLYTTARGPQGEAIGRLPEQVPYLEWRHSAFRDSRSCQSCHMPAVTEPAPMASVLGQARVGLARHTFIGGNVFMLRLLARYRTMLGVEALPAELEAVAQATERQLQASTASVSIRQAARRDDTLVVDVAVENLTGHKLPTGYPSRRAWLYLAVRDRQGRIVFESGAVSPTGRIAGNDHDDDPGRYEPHYTEIRAPDEVQIYEAVMADALGRPTTGLIAAVRFVKDNRLLPSGFDKATAGEDIAVRGRAAGDPDFQGGGDRVRYVVPVAGAAGPFRVDVALYYQSIAFRWAENLRPYRGGEPERFVGLYEAMAPHSAVAVARAAAEVP